MSLHAWLLTGMLIGAPPSAPADSAPTPKLEKGLEITWRGTFSEASLRPNVRAFRVYDIETRVFVLDILRQGADVAIFTKIKLKPELKSMPEAPSIVRLHLARVDGNGNLSLLPANALTIAPDARKSLPLPLMPIEGLPIFEPGVFVGFQTEKIRLGQAWDLAEEKRPPLSFRVESLDNIRGSRCYKITAAQQTEDWDKPRPDRSDWRRADTLWISAKHGYAARIERVIEKRDPQTGDLGFRSKLACDQIGTMRYPERFGDDRRDEIIGAANFMAQLEQLLPQAGRSGPRPFEQLLQQIEQHASSHVAGEAAPYREAIQFVKRKAEAAKRGHIPPTPLPPETGEKAALTIGKVATDIATTDLTNGESIRLSKLRGKPVVLLYYQSGSVRTAEPLLRFAQSLDTRHAGKAVVLPLVVGDPESAVQQRNDWRLAVHVLAGRDVYKQHGIESTPCFVVIDAEGIVRCVALGWSEENAAAVRTELEKRLK